MNKYLYIFVCSITMLTKAVPLITTFNQVGIHHTDTCEAKEEEGKITVTCASGKKIENVLKQNESLHSRGMTFSRNDSPGGRKFVGRAFTDANRNRQDVYYIIK